MSNPHIFRAERSSNPRSGRRRPTGMSRRQRKKQLGFETLEDRRVMSAQSPLASLQGAVDSSVSIQVTSLSSNSSEGALAIQQQEILWQSLIDAAQQDLQLTSFAFPDDPLLDRQWHLINSGQEVGNPDFQAIFGVPGEDINVAPVWQLGYTGEGVVVAVIDSGVEFTHPDLVANIDPTFQFDAITGDGDANPDLSVPGSGNEHGTLVAGIIAAESSNGLGGTGVAPNAQLVPIRLIDFGATGQSTVDAFRYRTNEIDITNNSWGPAVTRGIAGPTPAETLALRDSIIFGRDGLGVIHVFASGNDAGSPFSFGFQSQGSFDSSTYDGYVTSRYTIGVTGVDHDGFYNNIDGTVTNYPETSASVLVAAPTGSFARTNIADDTGIGSGIVTTDTTGETGANISPDPITNQEFDRDFLPDVDYTSRFNGTSAAAPMVSGVLALMLEANPNLSWRDVQEILLRSARQNAEFEIPNVANPGAPPTQNTWIVNQLPVFHDPDVFDGTVSPFLQTLNPLLDPTLSSAFNGLHYQPTPQLLTTGSGYTVSQGKGVHGEQIGYAHGVVDAELAVLLAEQWTARNQSLPDELTFSSFIAPEGGFFISLPAREQGNQASGFQVVPGGIGGTPGGGFIDYWNQYFVADPFANFNDNDTRGGFIELEVPDTNAMTVETLEVKVSVTGGTTQFLDNVRVLLISPDGTHHELNHYFQEDAGVIALPQNALNNTTLFREGGALVSNDTDPGNPLVATFSSNRGWGGRSDDALVIDPTTAEPASGVIAEQGWQLHMENYSDTAFQITGIEVVWHGSPIEAGTQRIQGLIGVDDNEDDLFNYSRVFQTIGSLPNDDNANTLRFGEVVNTVDISHESMGANVTVFAHRDVNNNGTLDASDILVDQFITGADGNYYFDVNPNFDYIISLEDAAGRTAVDDTLSPVGFLKDFQSEWVVTADFFKVWNYDASLEVPLNATTNAPFAFNNTVTPNHVTNINFLLDPGAPAVQEVVFSGSILVDINGDGLFNRDDIALPGVGVFGDVNRNGELDAGEILTTTGADGQYTLVIPTTSTSVINIGVRPPANWTASNPSSGFTAFFVEPGMEFTGIDFHIQPPSVNNPGDGSALSGIILGTVYDDANGDMNRQTNEAGVSGITVYLDLNRSGALDAGDIETKTIFNGAYVFANVPNGSYFLRMELDAATGITQSFPDFGLPQFASIVSGGLAMAVDFGTRNGNGTGGGGGGGGGTGTLDFGDLPEVYGTRLENGARHPAGNLFLGSSIDTELDGQPSDDALGDGADEDGVVLTSGLLVASSTATLTVTSSLHGGYLQAWMDFNNNGIFESSEQVIINDLLEAGTNTITFETPSSFGSSVVYARFRLGEFGLGSTGLALVGEVEDYAFAVDPGSIPQVVIHGPDFDEDGDVDGSDFLAWQRGAGTSSNASADQGDANSDGAVNDLDLAILQQDYGQGSPALVVTTGDFDNDGDVDGSDFLALQRGFGLAASLSSGDGDQDGDVDGADLQVWSDSFGQNSALLAAGSSSSVSAYGTLSVQDPTMTQPGFREDFVAGVVDTIDSSVAVDRQSLASVASEVDRLASRSRRGVTPFVRSEYRTDEGHSSRIARRAELGLALRDRVLDELFAKRHKAIAEMLPERLGELNAEEALADVFGEEIDWRLG